ncbi:MAG: hypothetical protein OXB88_06905 [Bacteriovoracales bacterium]|nr:hypothetical protein [Bacteriovoracales bacterium]
MLKAGLLISFLAIINNNPDCLASESSVYDFSWLDPDKEVYVLQNRKFRKKRSAFLSAGLGKGVSGAFVSSTQIQFRGGLFIFEDYGIGGLFSKNNSESDESYKDLLSQASTFPVQRLVSGYQGGMFLWSPFYSKGNFFNQIFYYDFIVGLGFAKLSETNNRRAAQDPIGCSGCKDELSHTGPLIDLEMKFFINEFLNTSLNVTAVYYKDDNVDRTKKFWFNHWDLTFSLGIVL